MGQRHLLGVLFIAALETALAADPPHSGGACPPATIGSILETHHRQSAVPSLSGDVEALRRMMAGQAKLAELEKLKGLPSLNEEVQSLIKGFADPDYPVRAQTLKALVARKSFQIALGPEREALVRAMISGLEPTPESIVLVREALSSTDTGLQRAATEQINQSWGSKSLAARNWVENLRQSPFDVRWHFSTQIAEMLVRGEKVEPLLLAALLEDPQFYVREPVESILTKKSEVLAAQPAAVRIRHRVAMATPEGQAPDLTGVPALFEQDTKVLAKAEQAQIQKAEVAAAAIQKVQESVPPSHAPKSPGFLKKLFGLKSKDQKLQKLREELASRHSVAMRFNRFADVEKYLLKVVKELDQFDSPDATTTMIEVLNSEYIYEGSYDQYDKKPRSFASKLHNGGIGKERLFGDTIEQFLRKHPLSYDQAVLLRGRAVESVRIFDVLLESPNGRLALREWIDPPLNLIGGTMIPAKVIEELNWERHLVPAVRKLKPGTEWGSSEMSLIEFIEAKQKNESLTKDITLAMAERQLAEKDPIVWFDEEHSKNFLFQRKPTPESYALVVSKLKNSQSEVRARALNLLREWSFSPEQKRGAFLQVALSDSDPNLRGFAGAQFQSFAGAQFQKFGNVSDSELKLIADQLVAHRSDALYLESGLKLLAHAPRPSQVESLLIDLATQGETPALRELGAFELEKNPVRSHPALEPVIQQLTDPDPSKRYNALRMAAVSPVEDARIDTAIREALLGKDAAFNAVAQKALSRRPLNDPKLLAQLRQQWEMELTQFLAHAKPDAPFSQRLKDLTATILKSDLDQPDALAMFESAVTHGAGRDGFNAEGVNQALKSGKMFQDPQTAVKLIEFWRKQTAQIDVYSGGMATYGMWVEGLLFASLKEGWNHPQIIDFAMGALNKTDLPMALHHGGGIKRIYTSAATNAWKKRDPQESYLIGRLLTLNSDHWEVIAALTSPDPRISEWLENAAAQVSYYGTRNEINAALARRKAGTSK